MNKDEEYVRSAWETVREYQGLVDIYKTPLSKVRSWANDLLTFDDWSAAAEFTRERLEQVRQLREEIALVESLSRHSGSPIAHACSGETIGHLQLDVKRFARWNRILSRLESELTRMTAGMKPEAL